MAVNKVIINGSAVLDLTSDTATADTVAEGMTFHNAAGSQLVGTMQAGPQPITHTVKSGVTVENFMNYMRANSSANCAGNSYGQNDTEIEASAWDFWNFGGSYGADREITYSFNSAVRFNQNAPVTINVEVWEGGGATGRGQLYRQQLYNYGTAARQCIIRYTSGGFAGRVFIKVTVRGKKV